MPSAAAAAAAAAAAPLRFVPALRTHSISVCTNSRDEITPTGGILRLRLRRRRRLTYRSEIGPGFSPCLHQLNNLGPSRINDGWIQPIHPWYHRTSTATSCSSRVGIFPSPLLRIHRLSTFRVTSSSLSVRLDLQEGRPAWKLGTIQMENLYAQEVQFSPARRHFRIRGIGLKSWEKHVPISTPYFGYLRSTCAS